MASPRSILFVATLVVGMAACPDAEPAAGPDTTSDVVVTDTASASDGGTDTPVPDIPNVDVGPDLLADAPASDVGPGDVVSDAVGQCQALPDSFTAVEQPPATPPFGGTVWFSHDLIVDSDPSSFVGLRYAGQEPRVMFDRRTNGWETYNAYLFDVQFGTSTVIEFQVNPEFSQAEAEAQVAIYAEAVGRLPAFLFSDFQTVWMHRGDEAFGGGNNNLLIHTDRAEVRAAEGTLEEVMLHELGHTSMDPHYAQSLDWLAAQAADGMAISDYALEFVEREDLAETVGPYLGLRFRPERLTPALQAHVLDTIPNRVLFLDCLELSMDPVP